MFFETKMFFFIQEDHEHRIDLTNVLHLNQTKRIKQTCIYKYINPLAQFDSLTC